MSQLNERATEAIEKARQQDDEMANGWVGAYVGHWKVLRREKPGARWLYVIRNGQTGAEKRLQGYELVRLARQAIRDGLPVIRLRQPWRNEAVE